VKYYLCRGKGSDRLSKQANQRYRKEKEKEHLKKAGVTDAASNSAKDTIDKKKYNNNTYNTEG
jgi:hypothetical protein